jgi:outer membrane protein
MKNFFSFFFLVLLFGSITLNAQDFAKKGAIELGGSVGFSSTTAVFDGETADNALSTFLIQPYIGYFVVDNLELALVPSLVYQSIGDFSSTAFGVFFAPAWNFDLKDSKIFPYIEGRIGYNTVNVDNGLTDNTNNGIAWGARGGAKFQLGNSALVNASVGYTQFTLEPDNWEGDRVGSNVFDLMAGFTVFFGN